MDWPDWRGQTVVVLATGPSATAEPVEMVRGRARVFAIKSAWTLAGWADALYGCDKAWWIVNKGATGFRGCKFSPSPTVARLYRDVREIRLKARADILTGEVGVVGCGLKVGGGHSGFQAINLAVQFGAKRILLVGFDMTLKHGAHWSKDYRGVELPDAARVESWRRDMDDCAPQFTALGVEVINCTMASALTAYPKRPLGEIFAMAAA